MLGLEIIAAIGAVVTAYGTCQDLYTKLNQKRALRQSRIEEDLQDSLVRSPELIMWEYDYGCQRFGQRFERGDGLSPTLRYRRDKLTHFSDIARAHMSMVIIKLQQELIDGLLLKITDGWGTFDGILGVSEESRGQAMSILSAHAQRCALQAPIEASGLGGARSGPSYLPDLNRPLLEDVYESLGAPVSSSFEYVVDIYCRETYRCYFDSTTFPFGRYLLRKGRRFTAKADFDAEYWGDLEIEQGEKITILGKIDRTWWWFGRKNGTGEVGIFPR